MSLLLRTQTPATIQMRLIFFSIKVAQICHHLFNIPKATCSKLAQNPQPGLCRTHCSSIVSPSLDDCEMLQQFINAEVTPLASCFAGLKNLERFFSFVVLQSQMCNFATATYRTLGTTSYGHGHKKSRANKAICRRFVMFGSQPLYTFS